MEGEKAEKQKNEDGKNDDEKGRRGGLIPKLRQKHIPSETPFLNYYSTVQELNRTTNLSMNQLVKYNDEAEIQDFNGDGNTWLTSILDVKKNNHILGSAVSEKELKIRSELEMEVERDLEEEIKDGICNLSLRLHRLYQRQKERQMKEGSDEDNTTKALSEVNISIKMEGKTKVEIKETKKEATGKGHHRRSWSHRSEDMKLLVSRSNGGKVDWKKSLRAGSGNTVSVNKRNGSPNRESDKGRANIKGRSRSSGRVKQQGKVDRKLLRLGWKF
ncbi:uncharacterized protein LOC114726832 [Neltuma alba]|uniref:uncharacterized protein LOC114726832 n=1 Tax=Neltuma alba TaxID=207710 RepID=UPI0010A34C89|nr:uncharacterized protein LOC114726832 [Prosopis alba]